MVFRLLGLKVVLFGGVQNNPFLLIINAPPIINPVWGVLILGFPLK